MPAVRPRLAPGARPEQGAPDAGAPTRSVAAAYGEISAPRRSAYSVLRGRVARVGRHDDPRREPVEALRDRRAVGEDDVGLVPVARDAVDEDVDVQDGVRAASAGRRRPQTVELRYTTSKRCARRSARGHDATARAPSPWPRPPTSRCTHGKPASASGPLAGGRDRRLPALVAQPPQGVEEAQFGLARNVDGVDGEQVHAPGSVVSGVV